MKSPRYELRRVNPANQPYDCVVLMEKLIQRLLSQKWTELRSGITSLEDGECPGVYLLAYTDKDLEGKSIKLSDIFYVGMSNSRGGVKQRLKQFTNAIEKDVGHSAGMRFLRKYANGVPFSLIKSRKAFFVASISIPCVVKKTARKAEDLRKMGEVVRLEYYMLAYIKEALGEEPELNEK